jgi:hypothetical protein
MPAPSAAPLARDQGLAAEQSTGNAADHAATPAAIQTIGRESALSGSIDDLELWIKVRDGAQQHLDVLARTAITQDALAPLLTDVQTFCSRFVVYPSLHAARAHALWIAHTHVMGAWDSTPRLAALSPEPASGKTRLLEITELLVQRPVEAVNVSAAYLFRKVSDPGGLPVILFDEVDTVFGPKAKESEDIRGLLNAGHRRGAVAGRCVIRGKTVETEELPAYCAVALAGLGDLPDTIISRSIVIRMRRRAPGERIEPYRRRQHAPQGHELRDRLSTWAQQAVRGLTDARPDMPPGIEDRSADAWEPLFAIADAAGEDWPTRARVAAVALVADLQGDSCSLGVRLLSDLKTVFGNSDALPTSQILDGLHAIEEAPWGDLRGKPLTSRGLAGLLRQYGVRSKNVRVGTSVPKGYEAQDLFDAWQRYLPQPPANCATSATAATSETGVIEI